MILEDESGKKLVRMRLAGDNQVQLSNMLSPITTRTSSTKASIGQWHSLEVHLELGGRRASPKRGRMAHRSPA